MGVRVACLTTPGYLFETTVLSAFAIAGRLGNLDMRYRSRACWVDVVQEEIMRGISVVSALGDVLASTWLPPPIETYAVKEIEHVRQLLGGHARQPREHLGRLQASFMRCAEAIPWRPTIVTRRESLKALGARSSPP